MSQGGRQKVQGSEMIKRTSNNPKTEPTSLLARLTHFRELKANGTSTATTNTAGPETTPRSTMIKSDSVDSPRYLPRAKTSSTTATISLPPGSPTLNRRKLSSNNATTTTNTTKNSALTESPIKTQSPKFFPNATKKTNAKSTLTDSSIDVDNSSKELLKERERVEFLQNYMAELVKAKDDSELEAKQLRSQVAALHAKNNQLEAELQENRKFIAQLESESLAKPLVIIDEVAQLKETIRLLELERSSNRNVCQKAIEVLDSKEIELLQKEVDRLKSKEQHYREANEIFQQKVQVLTEENRRLRGIKQSY